MRLVDIVALTGNVANALYGVENHLEHVEIGRETPTLDAAEAEIRALADALAKVLPRARVVRADGINRRDPNAARGAATDRPARL